MSSIRLRSEIEPILDILTQKYTGLLNKLSHASPTDPQWKQMKAILKDIAALHNRQRDNL
jgi:hypothetical protein